MKRSLSGSCFKNMSTRLREHEKRLQKGRAALLVGGGVDPTIALDSLAVLEETMRHFVFKARALEEEMALRANKGEEADFGAVDKARAEAGRWAKEVAEYRHAKISAVKLAGDPNVVMPDNMTLDQLREAILSDVARLADVLELDAESIRLPRGVENRLPVAPSNGGED
jgi:nicotinate-nucleotide pyrophosphorylase